MQFLSMQQHFYLSLKLFHLILHFLLVLLCLIELSSLEANRDDLHRLHYCYTMLMITSYLASYHLLQFLFR